MFPEGTFMAAFILCLPFLMGFIIGLVSLLDGDSMPDDIYRCEILRESWGSFNFLGKILIMPFWTYIVSTFLLGTVPAYVLFNFPNVFRFLFMKREK